MQFTFTLMDEADAQSIGKWHYEEQYAVYDIAADAEDDPAEMLDRRSPYYAVWDEKEELIGFFSFGTSAQPWGNDKPDLYSEDRIIDVGLGMRPDLTGKGLGLAFVNAGLAFATKQFAPTAFRMFVLAFNERAIRVYEKAGLKRTRTFMQQNIHGERLFLEMKREV